MNLQEMFQLYWALGVLSGRVEPDNHAAAMLGMKIREDWADHQVKLKAETIVYHLIVRALEEEEEE